MNGKMRNNKALLTTSFYLVSFVLTQFDVSLVLAQFDFHPSVEAVLSELLKPKKERKVVEIPVSRETTFVVDPVDQHGRVNFQVAHQNWLYSDVTPGENAAIDLVKQSGIWTEADFPNRDRLIELGFGEGAEDERFLSLEVFARRMRVDLKDVQNRVGSALESKWSEASDPLLADWIKSNTDALTKLIEVSKKPKFYLPSMSGADGSLLMARDVSIFIQVSEMATCLCCRANLYCAKGDFEAAMKDWLAAFRLSRLTAQEAGEIPILVSLTINRRAVQASHVWVRSLPETFPFIDRCLTELESLEPILPFEKSLRYERLPLIELIVNAASNKDLEIGTYIRDFDEGDPTLAVLVAFNRIDYIALLTELNSWHDRHVDALNRNSYRDALEAIERFDAEINAAISIARKYRIPMIKLNDDALHEDDQAYALGRILALLPMFPKEFLEIRASQSNQFRQLKMALRIMAFKQQHGQMPTTLQEVVTARSREPLEDQFTGKPFLFRALEKGFLIYDRGPNGVDDGGPNENLKTDDRGIQIEFGTNSD